MADRGGSKIIELFHRGAELWLKGPLDTAALDAAFADLVEQHESRRAIFFGARGEPRQHIIDTSKVRRAFAGPRKTRLDLLALGEGGHV